MSESKAALRKVARSRLGGLGLHRADRDSDLIRQLDSLLSTMTYGMIAAYAAMPMEPDLFPFLSRCLSVGLRICFPAYDESSGIYSMVEVHDLTADLREGRYGILEPAASLTAMHPPFVSSTPWIWLVPALGYDLHGHRLGHGGGYYDRLLEGANGVKVGIAYECQLVDAVPFAAHDICMDYVVTESRHQLCE